MNESVNALRLHWMIKGHKLMNLQELWQTQHDIKL